MRSLHALCSVEMTSIGTVMSSGVERTLGQAKRQSRALHALRLVEMTTMEAVISSLSRNLNKNVFTALVEHNNGSTLFYRYRAIIVTIPLLTISPSDSRLEPLKRHPSDVCKHTDLQPSVPSRTTVSSFWLYQSYPSSLSRRPLPLESSYHHQV